MKKERKRVKQIKIEKKNDRDLKLLGMKFWQITVIFKNGKKKKKGWMRIPNIRLFRAIQPSIILPQRTQTNQDPG